MHFVPQGLQTQPYKMRPILSRFGALTVFSHPIHPHNSPLSKGLALWGFLRLVFKFPNDAFTVCMHVPTGSKRSPAAANTFTSERGLPTTSSSATKDAPHR